jgi:DNA-binding transcriptional ArsR family regulator
MTPDLDVLADPTRRAMLALLVVETELCVCEMEAALDEIQPVVSRQFAILRDAGWVTGRRDGRRIFYSVSPLPEWARLIVRAYAEGGVPPKELKGARARLGQFEGRPIRFSRAAS